MSRGDGSPDFYTKSYMVHQNDIHTRGSSYHLCQNFMLVSRYGSLEPSIWAEPVGPARFCLSPVGPGLGFRGKNRGVGPEGPALKG